jgi:hypothetical protein
VIDIIEKTIVKIENKLIDNLPESKYQFELYDLITNTKYFRGYSEPFHWGSLFKLFVVAEIIKMIEENKIKSDDKLILHKELSQKGNGVLKFMTHLNELTYIDACKIMISTSDNICADELLKVVGFERFNNLFTKSNCFSSKLSVNLDTLVTNLYSGINKENTNAFYYRSEMSFIHFSTALAKSLIGNYTSAMDINKCWHFIIRDYLNEDSSKLFKSCFQLFNVHSRFNNYLVFSKFSLFGKTGTLGSASINNEVAAITLKGTSDIYGYFSLLTKNNTKRYFQSADIFALVGLEIAALYEELYKRIK